MYEDQILANKEALLAGISNCDSVYTATCPLEIGYPFIDQLIDTWTLELHHPLNHSEAVV
jgi:hypothetical protein